MNFARPAVRRSFEAEIAHQAALMKARRQKAAERRRDRHDGFYDSETVEVEPKPLPAQPPACVNACGRKARARKGGLCAACTKRNRRRNGLDN